MELLPLMLSMGLNRVVAIFLFSSAPHHSACLQWAWRCHCHAHLEKAGQRLYLSKTSIVLSVHLFHQIFWTFLKLKETP